MEIIKRLNWLDIFYVIVLVRIFYVTLCSEFTRELFKFLGAMLAAYLSLHYYISLGGLFLKITHLSKTFIPFLTFLSFILLAVLGYIIFIVLRNIFFRFFNIQPNPELDKWGGLILSMIRGFLILSIFSYGLAISPISYFKNSTKDSLSGRYIIRVAPFVYLGMWNILMSKFMVGEDVSPFAWEIPDSLSESK
ncbi:MAG: CvpA family protein [Candidatus Omnitrophica bacterium]|nr:CvpA family protein [Candidatus Omnitrophota bacterium]